MAQDIELMGAQYSDVPSVELPKVGGGTASFTDVTDTTATDADVMSGSYFYNAAGVRSAGTLNFPVTSVNGMTGAVTVTVPTALSELTNDIGAMKYLGVNVITDSANDTATNWIGFGTGYSMFSTTGALMNKPANYGMVLSWVNVNNVTQLWITVGGNNSVWKRSGDNANSNPGGWYGGGWTRLAEVSEVPTQVSDLTNDSGYITSSGTAAKVAHALTMTVPAGTDKTFDGSAVQSISMQDLAFLGNNAVAATANDTPANWRTLGSGFATYSSGGRLIDQPAAVGVLLNLTRWEDYTFQLFIPRSGGSVYVRYANSAGTGWSGTWSRLTNEGDVYYSAGDTFTLNNYVPVSGYVTGSSHRVYLTVTVPKSLANISTVTVTALKGALIGNVGALDGSGDNTDWLTSSSWSTTATKIADNTVLIRMTKSAAITGVSNTTLCCIDANPITLSFS